MPLYPRSYFFRRFAKPMFNLWRNRVTKLNLRVNPRSAQFPPTCSHHCPDHKAASRLFCPCRLRTIGRYSHPVDTNDHRITAIHNWPFDAFQVACFYTFPSSNFVVCSMISAESCRAQSGSIQGKPDSLEISWLRTNFGASGIRDQKKSKS